MDNSFKLTEDNKHLYEYVDRDEFTGNMVYRHIDRGYLFFVIGDTIWAVIAKTELMDRLRTQAAKRLTENFNSLGVTVKFPNGLPDNVVFNMPTIHPKLKRDND